jgi:hypothetical protein
LPKIRDSSAKFRFKYKNLRPLLSEKSRRLLSKNQLELRLSPKMNGKELKMHSKVLERVT